MQKNKRIVIVGATSAIAERCARVWAKDSHQEIILIGRNQEKIERVSLDLKARAPNVKITRIIADFSNPAEIQKEVDNLFNSGGVDVALIAHGFLPNQRNCEQNLNWCKEALEINAISPVLFAEAFAMRMEKYNRGTIAVIGSVAGDRGRKLNYIYGASKGLIARYLQGLQHRFADTKVKVVLIKPGPTNTPMTAHLKHSGAKLAEADYSAREIVKAIEKGRRVVYVPKIWSGIMLVIRHLPYFVFKRMSL